MTPKIQLFVSVCFMVLAGYVMPDCASWWRVVWFGVCLTVASVLFWDAVGLLR